jgi:putative oxidoreductase
VALALRFALGGYFAWSGYQKVFVQGLDDFTRAVANYKMVYAPWDAVVAYTIPWVEMVCGVLLVLGLWKRGALWGLTGLIAGFAVGVAHAQANKLNIACGCDGNPDAAPMNYSLKFLELGACLLAIFFIWFLGRKGNDHVFAGTRLKLPG